MQCSNNWFIGRSRTIWLTVQVWLCAWQLLLLPPALPLLHLLLFLVAGFIGHVVGTIVQFALNVDYPKLEL